MHLLTRVPAKEVQGRNVLRWDVHKMSFAALPEPFGQLRLVDLHAVTVEMELQPEGLGETKTERAVRAMQSFLELKQGTVVNRQELLQTAIREGNVKESAAKIALRVLRERLGDAVASVKLPGRRQPVGFRLKGVEDAGPAVPEPQMTALPSGTVEGLEEPRLARDPKAPRNDRFDNLSHLIGTTEGEL